MDSVPRVPRAGQVETLEDGTRIQLMHNGLRVLTDGYLGTWTTRLIELCHGCHEPQEERVFDEVMARLPAEATMIELGGYWSYYSLWFLTCGKDRRSIVLEPDPKHLKVGRTNASLNGLMPTFIHGFAGGVALPPVPFKTEDSGELLVPCFNVPILMESHGIDKLDVLHSDIQGAEFDVLLSCKELFEQQRIKFAFVSTHDFRISADPLVHQRCLALIRDCGGRIIAEHDIHESFSGDGLIVAYFGDDTRMWSTVPVSRNRYSESLFRNPLFDLAAVRAHAEVLETALHNAVSHSEDLKQQLETTLAQTANLQNDLQVEQMQTAFLRNALQAEQAHVANLHSILQAEQVQVANLSDALRTEHAQMDRLDTHIRNLETQLAVPSIDRATGRVLSRLHKTGDRLTGGGIRASTKRVLMASLRSYLSFAGRHPRLAAIPRGLLKPFPKLTAALYQVAAPPDKAAATAASAGALPVETGMPPVHSEDPIAEALPSSARHVYLKLRSAASNDNASRQIP